MSGNKIIICPGAFYNEHVEQQNIFGVVNVYPPKDGERGGQTVSSVQLIDCSEDEDLEAEDVAAADISQKETGRGRKSECLFARDENYCVKDEAETRKQADLFCRFRCNMWMLLIVKLLSFKRYNYPFYKCRESGRQMQCAYSQSVSDEVVPLLFSLFCKILETNAMHCFSASSVSCVTERLSGCKDTDLYWIRANYYLKKYYFIPCVISSIQAYYRSRSSCLSLLSFQITSGSCIVCNGTLTIESEATFS